MLNWFAANLGTILISIVLVGVVALIIMNLRNKKKQGHSCSGNCSHCGGTSCHHS